MGERTAGQAMAITKCSQCGGTFWEVKTLEPAGSKLKQNVLQCSACGVPVGVVELLNAGIMLREQEKKLSDLAKKVGNISAALQSIQNAIRR
jgi:hypothetical protein